VSRRDVSRRVPRLALVVSSPLRLADPRTKLALSLSLSLSVMLPLQGLVAAMAFYGLLLWWARLLPAALRQIWRLKWVLLVLFVVDWFWISAELAVAVSLRILMLTGTFALLVATTLPEELRLALEWLRVPYRYAFSVGLAFQTVNLLDNEWRAIREAQRARGAWAPLSRWRNVKTQVRDLVALAVPAIVMTTKRAWAMTEAAYARGFGSPQRRPWRWLTMGRLDWMLLVLTLLFSILLFTWR
jgi:energy-coupling factor transport system permease protein